MEQEAPVPFLSVIPVKRGVAGWARGKKEAEATSHRGKKALRFPGLYGSKSLVLMPQAFAPSCLVFGPGLVAPAKKHYSRKTDGSKFKIFLKFSPPVAGST